MNPDLQKLQAYPFAKLNQLLGKLPAAQKPAVNLSIGEPKHAAPDFVLNTIQEHLNACNRYPKTKGLNSLRECIAQWLSQRFSLSNINPETNILPVNGTREALFAFAQCIVNRQANNPLVLCPNPFYQIYEGAAYLAGAQPVFLACTPDNGYIPDFSKVSEATWQDCQLLYICSPGNPSGAVMSLAQMKTLIELSDKYNFVIASDECYSEIYSDLPPPGLLQACQEIGRDDYKNCVVFHSLSKRSNLPGLRSGFVAGDADILQNFLNYRTYHGCAMSEMVQYASIAAWSDESHAAQNRQHYQEKFAAALPLLQNVCDFPSPPAGFYIWLPTPIADDEFAARLYTQEHITVLPGSFLSREVDDQNPGANHVRIALVAEKDECIDAVARIADFIQKLM